MASRVFVTHTTGRVSFDEATRYGTIIHMFPLQLYPDQFEARIPMAVDRFTRLLANFDPERDFLLPSGDPVLTLLSGLVLGERCSRVTALHWDRQACRYFPVELILKEIGNERSDQGPGDEALDPAGHDGEHESGR